MYRFHCDGCDNVQLWNPIKRPGQPAGLHLFRQRLRKKHGGSAPVYPKRSKRLAKWKGRRRAGHWICVNCAADLRDPPPGMAKAILRKHAHLIAPRTDDAEDTADSDGASEYDDDKSLAGPARHDDGQD